MKEWPRTKIQEYPLLGFHAIFFQQNVLKKPTSNKREPFYNTWNWKKRERKLESLQKNRTYCTERVTVALAIKAENASWEKKLIKLFHPWKACLEPSRQKAGNKAESMNALAGSTESTASSIAKLNAIPKQPSDNVTHFLGKGISKAKKIQQSLKAIGSAWNTFLPFQPKNPWIWAKRRGITYLSCLRVLTLLFPEACASGTGQVRIVNQ